MDHLMRWASWCWLVESVWVLGDELREDCREDGRLSDEECCLLIVCPGVLVRGKVVQELSSSSGVGWTSDQIVNGVKHCLAVAAVLLSNTLYSNLRPTPFVT